jgi:hypothetical protein
MAHAEIQYLSAVIHCLSTVQLDLYLKLYVGVSLLGDEARVLLVCWVYDLLAYWVWQVKVQQAIHLEQHCSVSQLELRD